MRADGTAAGVAPRQFGAGASGSIMPGVSAPPLWVEWWYFAQVFYAIMGTAIGLSLGFVGVLMLALLSVSSLLRTGRRFLAVLLPLALPIAFGTSYLAVQIVVFHESPMNENIRPLISWLLGIVAIQCLAQRRGFLHRAAMAITVLGLCTLPFMTLYRGSTRIGLTTGISIANPNDLSAWFGFCALYFAVVGLEARRMAIRIPAALAATGCVVVMALTVSRGPLFALALALLIAFRRVLKRGIFALLPIVIIGWGVYEMGVFDQSAAQYASRGLEESGRFLVWPLAIARFLQDPFTGVGVSQVGTFVAIKTIDVTPHNQFIFVALAGGILPLVLFIMYWVDLGRTALRLQAHGHEDAVLLVPLFAYVLLIGMQLNQPYMLPWVMIVLGSLSATGFALRATPANAGRLHPGRRIPLANPAFASARTRG